MTRPKYKIIKDTPDLILIRDLGGATSVTNCVEIVVEELAPQLRGRRLEYYDTQGRRDRILVQDGKFAGFELL